MTDNQRDYEKAICEIAGVSDIGEVSDGFHTFNSLYHQRAILFAALVNQNASKAWKTRKHEDGEPCFGGGWFLVTIDTPDGPYGYHYEEKYWDLFQCEELDRAKHWDGYTDEDVPRLLSLSANLNMGNDGAERMTNADRIRQMTDEELAEMFDIESSWDMCKYCSFHGDLACYAKCREGITKWLEQGVNCDD